MLVDSHGNQLSAFSCELAMTDLLALEYPLKKYVILEAELLALLVSFALFQKSFERAAVRSLH